MRDLALITELRKGPVKPTGHRIARHGPLALEQDSAAERYPGDRIGEVYTLAAIFQTRFVLLDHQAETRDLAHRNAVRNLAGGMFGDLWVETFEIERLMHEVGITYRSDEPGYEIMQRLNAIREATGYRL